MKPPSASNAEAFVMCTASHVLPQHDAHTKRAAAGNMGHEPLAAVINHRASSVAIVDNRARKFPLATVTAGVTELEAEVAYVVNIEKRTSRRLGKDLGSKARETAGALDKYEIITVLDAQGSNADGVPWIRDWKFGTHSSWWQIFIQAMAVAWDRSATSPSHVDAGIVYINQDSQGAEYDEDAKTIYAMDLDDRADELMSAFKRADALEAMLQQGQQVRTVEGPWCTYCGAYPHCPSKMNLVRAMVAEMNGIDASLLLLSPEELGAAFLKYKEVKRIVEKMGETFKDLARPDGIPLPNGKQLKVVATRGWKYFDRGPTWELLKAKGASKEEIEEVMKQRADSESLQEKVKK